MMLRRWPEILRDRDEVTARAVEVGERLLDLADLLTHAEDEVALRDHSGCFGLGEDVEAAIV